MTLPRRALLAALALPALARAQPAAALPPILFVHGNGDHAALWMTTLWRFAANGWPEDRLRAVNMPDPLARADDAVAQPHRSSSAEQAERLRGFVAAFLAETGAPRLALVGNSRGGYPIRDLLMQGGAAQVSHAVTCGTPNRGVFDWEHSPGSEFNARAAFLRRLNAGDADTVEGVAMLAIRSDNDLFAQPDGRFVGRPGTPTGITQDGPMLRGARNILLPGLDHRETAYHWRAFREQFLHIAGREPWRLDVADEPRVTLDGLVTGLESGAPTNRPVAGAIVEVFRVDAETAERTGPAIHRRETGADGRWGPVAVSARDLLEIVLAAPGHPVAHYFRSPFPRATAVLHLRPPAALSEADRAAGCVVRLTRPRGYFGWPRDVVLMAGEAVAEAREGVASIALATRRFPAAAAGRAVRCVFNGEEVTARAVPLAENRIAIAELTW